LYQTNTCLLPKDCKGGTYPNSNVIILQKTNQSTVNQFPSITLDLQIKMC
jgi:hypothetical protein